MHFLRHLFAEMVFYAYLCRALCNDETIQSNKMKARHYLKHLWLSALVLLTLTQPAVFTSCTTTKVSTELVTQNKYPELPPLRAGAVYSARLENVRRIALEDEQTGAIPAGSYREVTSRLTADNVLYQTDPNGKLVASIPLIAAMIDRDAARISTPRMQQVFDEAYADGLKFTAQLFDIAIANHLYLDGLENAVKGASHIVDKANRKLGQYRSANDRSDAGTDEVAEGLNDLVRYSAITTKDKYVEATLALISSLEAAGYTVAKVDNRFLGKDGKQDLTLPYRAIHLDVRSGKRQIEIQVHDHSSQSIRESTHELYEKMRQLDPQSDEYKRLDQLRLEAWKPYVNPEGIERIVPRDNTKNLETK